ncbi:MAG: phytanoyl-CoA dioxygenase family protein [Pseudoalteromonas sp.]|uniref:phytanoyl-CoA dioxygenase family protein n=1 Tax=unclassified Pseudoalteromonas TaxID=194690 RepID=UPI000C06AFC9|nr:MULTISPECIES: phytanoyl-CoA dioxygenase family protein [unclassified Pseudoalteromonas]MDP2633354.1 phytanoyl-CoA dioxygenase family protein [Pseudoalteromonas sp. 1_MG-2023]PHN91678.1 phytanoyl-CoA dioxygenase [Pseudoalteromonas sp. 3D05]TGE84758.1 phytanoyl-CoA dioxygenase [Pseudoalteromonas sp. KS88]
MINTQFCSTGFFHIPGFYTEAELCEVREVVKCFHQQWIPDNHYFYKSKAVNSAYLTANTYLNDAQRMVLFKFIASFKLMAQVDSILTRAAFINTQLFFNPVNPEQENYWHRDMQYHLDIKEQQAALTGPEVIHCRVALEDEPGIELVPGTHRRWDTPQELATRLAIDHSNTHDDLPTGHTIEMQAGDLLIFSANMIHRGLYGKDRLALDVLFGEPQPDVLHFVQDICLPSPEMLDELEDASPFAVTLAHQ